MSLSIFVVVVREEKKINPFFKQAQAPNVFQAVLQAFICPWLQTILFFSMLNVQNKLCETMKTFHEMPDYYRPIRTK